jgi:hypothetical protein
MFYICTESYGDNLFNATGPISKFIQNQWESLKQCAHSSNGHCLHHQCPLLLWLSHINAKTDAQIAFRLNFVRSTYAQKAKEINFPIKLDPCPNSSRINRNHRNNALRVATCIADITSALCYYNNSSNGHCWHPQCPLLLCFYLFSTTSLSKIGTELLKNWSERSYIKLSH